jgi:hypothetical protein
MQNAPVDGYAIKKLRALGVVAEAFAPVSLAAPMPNTY